MVPELAVELCRGENAEDVFEDLFRPAQPGELTAQPRVLLLDALPVLGRRCQFFSVD